MALVHVQHHPLGLRGSPSMAVNARIARTPPIPPASTSWIIRGPDHPVTSRSVDLLRISCFVLRTSESSRSNGTRPPSRDPDPCPHCGVGGNASASTNAVGRSAGRVQSHREPLRVQRRVVSFCQPSSVSDLAEVPGTVIEAHCVKRHAQIGRGRQMVTRRESRARPEYCGQHLGDAEVQSKLRLFPFGRWCAAPPWLSCCYTKRRGSGIRSKSAANHSSRHGSPRSAPTRRPDGFTTPQRHRVAGRTATSAGSIAREEVFGVALVPRPSQVGRKSFRQRDEARGRCGTDEKLRRLSHITNYLGEDSVARMGG